MSIKLSLIHCDGISSEIIKATTKTLRHSGDDIAIFEAAHGSVPDIAGKNIANSTVFTLYFIDV